MDVPISSEAAPFITSIVLIVLGLLGAKWAETTFLEQARVWLQPDLAAVDKDVRADNDKGDQDAAKLRERRLIRYANYWADVPQVAGYLAPPALGIVLLDDASAAVRWAYLASVVIVFAVALRSAFRGPRHYTDGKWWTTPVQATALVLNVAGVVVCVIAKG